ncbi:MAG TPA: DUF5666 domain-containing protein, partial [Planctomycetota bacterium]|nr:DUF5666 domain-containing protein [Planctomycetota bacterium]
MKSTRTFGLVLSIAALTVLMATGCGGGGGGSSSSPGGMAVFSSGPVTALGSVTVNGIKFEDTAADITGDDSPKTLADIRKVGAVLRIRGRLNADGISGTADRIEIENELRGPIASITLPDTFVVLGQTVVVDGGTTFEDTTGLAGADPLAVSEIVEVHGPRDAAGQVRATRVERMGAPGVDELRGFITAKTGAASGTVTIGGADFTFDGSTVLVPAGAAFDVGTLVEVHLAGTAITRLEVEDLDESELKPTEGTESRIEGLVSGFTSLASTFFVAGQLVDASAARFEAGVAADLANDVRVEAQGTMTGGVLVAREIEFEDSIRIQSVVQSGGVSMGMPGTLEMMGLTIDVTAATDNQQGDINPGDFLEIRGFLNVDGLTITATRIESIAPLDADQHFLQGVVTVKNAATLHLTILGIDVNAA